MTFEDKVQMAVEMDREFGTAGSVAFGVHCEEEHRNAQVRTAVKLLHPCGEGEGPYWAMAAQVDLACDGASFEEALDGLLRLLRRVLIERAEAFETKAEGDRQRARLWRILADKVQAPQIAHG
jgi:hypothetical protein